jgi:hypothetical protein
MTNKSDSKPVWTGVAWRMPKWGGWDVADYATEEDLEAKVIPQYPDEDDLYEERVQRQDDWRYERGGE